MKTDKKKIELIKRLAGEIEYKEIKRITKGELSINQYQDIWGIYLEDLKYSLSSYKEHFAFIGSYHGVFLHPIDDIFEDIEINLDEIIPSRLLQNIYASDLKYSIKKERFIWDGYITDNTADYLEDDLEKITDYIDSLDTITKYAKGYSQGESMTGVIIFKEGTPFEIQEEVEGMFNDFENYFTTTEFNLSITEEITKQFADGSTETVEDEIDSFGIMHNEAYFTDKELEELKEEYNLDELTEKE